MDDPLQQVQLTKRLHLWQRARGHRVGTDDVLAAWAAANARPDASTILELGCGHGAVTLMLAERLPDATILAVEAQSVSHTLLERNVREADLGRRVETVLGDIRTTDAIAEQHFDLITGTPPFMPVGSGTMPDDAQRAAARFELRGGIEAYCAVAARHLAPDGVLSLVMDAERPERYEDAITGVGLHLSRVLTVRARVGGAHRYLIYWARRRADETARDTLSVRNDAGAWTPAFTAIRKDLALVGA